MNQSLLDEILAAGLSSGGDTSLPETLVCSLKEENYFTLLLPAKLGGKQMNYPEYIRLVQAVAKADGSTAWCVNQGSVLSTLARLLPTAVAQAIWHCSSVTLANGPPAKCHSTETETGYSLTGSWTFSSGINHADWLLAMAPVKGKTATKKILWHLLPRHEASIGKAWQVNGLKATGSFEFSVANLEIPTTHAINVQIHEEDPPLYQIPLNLLFACGFAAVALGVSRSALDCAIEKLRHKVKRFEKQTMSEDLLTQSSVGRSEALWQSADAYLHHQVDAVWQSLSKNGYCSFDDKIKLRLAATHVIRQSKEVTDLAYDLCSTDSIFEDQEIHKRFQDMHVITQHLQGRPEIYSLVGKHYLGLPAHSHLIS